MTALKQPPLVSIVTIVRNGEDSIETTIQSIVNQSYPNIEYIIIDGKSTVVAQPPGQAASRASPKSVAGSNLQTASGPGMDSAPEPGSDLIEVPLIRLAWARSGDKGDISNIGVIAREPGLLPLLRAQVTEATVAAFLAHLVKGKVTRFEVPGIHAFNFVCEQALDGGGMASMRNDPLGKGMAQILLSMPVRVPAALLGFLSSSA